MTAPPAPPTLTSISVAPGSGSIEEGQTQQFTATGTFSDSTTSDLTATATWSSSNTAVATINASGLATGGLAGTTNISASQDGVTSNIATLTVTAPAPPPPTPQGAVSISGPASIDRGDNTSFTVTLTNTGSSTITGGQLTFAVSPTDLLKNVSPGNSVNIGNVAPGGSVSQTWTARGDNEGSGTVTATASSGGTTLDTVIHSLTVIK